MSDANLAQILKVAESNPAAAAQLLKALEQAENKGKATPKAAPKQATKPVNETPEQELARLRAENEALRNRFSGKLTLKVAEASKGLSVYGLGRNPVTLYKKQWIRLLAISGEIQEFIKAHDGELAADK